MDLLILYSFLIDSPEITEIESNELFRTHKTIVNEGRKHEVKITTLKGETSIKEEALRLLEGMNEIAQFMDNEVGEGISSKWSDTVNQQRKVIENLDLSLSGLLLKDIENKKITFQEYGLQLSRAHKKEMDDLVLNGNNNFNESSKESLLAAPVSYTHLTLPTICSV